MAGGNRFGLSAEARARLIEKLATSAARPGPAPGPRFAAAGRLEAAQLNGAKEIRLMRQVAASLGISDPFFRMHDGIAAAETTIDGKRYVNFASYNYLGLNGHAEIAAASKAAIDRWGTSVSASRLVSGERPVHRALEEALARVHAAEDSVALVGGHSTNVTLLGQLLGPNDVVVHDALIHNSVVEGIRLSGARRISFAHLDYEAAGRVLAAARPRNGHALLVIEGHYSMDGDVPDLPRFISAARRHRAWLMVDEAHALGVLGPRGFGTAEHFGADPSEVDIWMGTLSKSLVSCGGYIAGGAELIAQLKRLLPGFVFSVGLAPPAAAAALAALGILRREPERVRRLNDRAALFLRLAREGGLNVGGSVGAAIVPIITSGSIHAARLAQAMFHRGINVQPILYPAVPEGTARLRFFLTAEHSEDQIRATVHALVEEERRIAAQPTDIADVMQNLSQNARSARG